MTTRVILQGYIVLDGSAPARDRHARIRQFKEKEDVRIALVSVTAGGQGVDLSAASVGVFVEMPPDVSWCRQVRTKRPNAHIMFILAVVFMKITAKIVSDHVFMDRPKTVCTGGASTTQSLSTTSLRMH